MAKAQLLLTPAESKKLISQAIYEMDGVKQALKKGTVALHPSSSTYFIAQQILGRRPPTDVWVCGTILPKGLCGDMVSGVLLGSQKPDDYESSDVSFTGHKRPFTFTWVFKKGKLEEGRPLEEVLEELGPGDFYVKGPNALDTNGRVGILIGASSKIHDEAGGTIGRAMMAARTKGFQILFPTGLEKLIPIPVEEAAKETTPRSYSYLMGHGAALLPGEGKVITELDAIKMLTGATAIPFAAGGLAGAEGSIAIIAKGEQAQVDKIVAIVEKVKGAKLPPVRERNCQNCERLCSLAGESKPWVV